MKDGKRLSVSQLNGYIKSVFDDELILHNIGVYGELSQISVRDNCTYFTITEGNSYINCVMFSTMEKIEIGTEILVCGRVTYYTKSGKINFTAKSVIPIGKGAQHNKFLQLKSKLYEEGLFDNRLQPPIYIKEVSVITSSAGAVIHDIMSVIRDKGVSVKLKLIPAQVQGDNADKELISALNKANASDSDAILIARGGGSSYDLDAFNSEALARAVANSAKPVISAVGHETDYTLCDFCAGKRAGTPSIAADMIAAINIEFYSRLISAYKKLGVGITRIFNSLSSRLIHSATKVVYAMDNRADISLLKVRSAALRLNFSMRTALITKRRQIENFSHSLSKSLDINVLNHETRFNNAVKTLEYSSPLKILGKGYARIKKGDYDVNCIDDLCENDNIKLILKDGICDACVKNIRKIKR